MIQETPSSAAETSTGLPGERSLDIASFIATSCKEARISLGLTLVDLARRANIANRSVSRVEDVEEMLNLTDALQKSASLRYRRIWVRTLAKLALALGRNPEEWISKLSFRLPQAEIHKIIQKAKRHQAEESNLALPKTVSSEDYWSDICVALNVETPQYIHVPVGMLRFGPFCGMGPDSGSFFRRFSERLLRTVHPRLRARFEGHGDGTMEFKRLTDGMTALRPEYRLTLGLFSMVARRRLGLGFIDIPGFRIRLSFLALRRDGSPRHWRDITDALQAGSKEIRVMTDAGEAAHFFLRCYVHRDADIDAFPNYDPKELAAEFSKKLASQMKRTERDTSESKASHWVLATDELAAVQIRMLLHAKGIELIDLGEMDDVTPSYPVALAIRQSDLEWGKTLEAVIRDEIFTNHADELAAVYEDYLIGALQLQRRYVLSVAPRDTFWWRRSVPSFLRLVAFGRDIQVSSSFKMCLRKALREFLRENDDFIGGEEFIIPVIERILPWKRELSISKRLARIERILCRDSGYEFRSRCRQRRPSD